MKHLIAMTAAVTLIATSATLAQAQFHISSGYSSHFGHHSHSYTHSNVHRLSSLVGQLEEVCSHLHGDAHSLSQDYANSAAIERYISELEQLKVHMHEMLEEAAAHHAYSASVERHIKHDTTEVRNLLNVFYSLIEGQAYMGARPADQALLDHMQEIVLHEAYPLLGRVETELYGRPRGDLCPLGYTAARPTISHHGHGGVQLETRTNYRPSVPPVPPFAARIMSQQGHPIPAASRQYGRSQGSIQIGRLRIRF